MTLIKSWTRFIYCPKVGSFRNQLLPLSKKWPNFGYNSVIYFDYSFINVIVGLKLLTSRTNLTTLVFVQRKQSYLVLIEITSNGDRGTHMQGFLKKRNLILGHQCHYFLNFVK